MVSMTVTDIVKRKEILKKKPIFCCLKAIFA